MLRGLALRHCLLRPQLTALGRQSRGCSVPLPRKLRPQGSHRPSSGVSGWPLNPPMLSPAPPMAAKKALAPPSHFLVGSQKRVFSVPNNRVRTHRTAAKPRLTAPCNSRAPPVALGRQESVRRVVVCKSVARTYAVPRSVAVAPRLDPHNRRAEPWLCSRSHNIRSRN
jgi:hypothetical protein